MSKPKAMRFNKAKPDLSYTLEFGQANFLHALNCMFGEAKYDRGNWRAGDFPAHELFACAQRHEQHAYDHLVLGKGDGIDEDSGLHALAGAMWNLKVLAELYLSPEDLMRFKSMEEFIDHCNETRERYAKTRADYKGEDDGQTEG